jgi:hypothetical protein
MQHVRDSTVNEKEATMGGRVLTEARVKTVLLALKEAISGRKTKFIMSAFKKSMGIGSHITNAAIDANIVFWEDMPDGGKCWEWISDLSMDEAAAVVLAQYRRNMTGYTMSATDRRKQREDNHRRIEALRQLKEKVASADAFKNVLIGSYECPECGATVKSGDVCGCRKNKATIEDAFEADDAEKAAARKAKEEQTQEALLDKTSALPPIVEELEDTELAAEMVHDHEAATENIDHTTIIERITALERRHELLRTALALSVDEIIDNCAQIQKTITMSTSEVIAGFERLRETSQRLVTILVKKP